MMEAWTYLLGMGFAALFGLKNALNLASRYRKGTPRHLYQNCDRVIHSSEAFIGKIPVAYGAALFYVLVLGQLLHMFQQNEGVTDLFGTMIVGALGVTCYYAYLLFFKLRTWCVGCMKLYLANGWMGLCLLGYYLSS